MKTNRNTKQKLFVFIFSTNQGKYGGMFSAPLPRPAIVGLQSIV